MLSSEEEESEAVDSSENDRSDEVDESSEPETEFSEEEDEVSLEEVEEEQDEEEEFDEEEAEEEEDEQENEYSDSEDEEVSEEEQSASAYKGTTSSSHTSINTSGKPAACVVCCSSPSDYIFSDCNHIVCCASCASKFKVASKRRGEESATKCPVCRTPLTQLPTKVFF